MFIKIVLRLGSDRPSGLNSFVPIHTHASSYLLAVLISECSGIHSCMSSPFPIAKLNDTSFFLSLVQEKLIMQSGHYYRHCS